MPPYEGDNSWHGVRMKRVDWLRKIFLGSCENAQQRGDFNRLMISAPLVGRKGLSSRATMAVASGVSATGAAALGALSIGALTIGFLVVGRLIIREMLIKRVHLRYLKIDQLEVEDLRVSKLTVLEDQRPSASPDKSPAEQ